MGGYTLYNLLQPNTPYSINLINLPALRNGVLNSMGGYLIGYLLFTESGKHRFTSVKKGQRTGQRPGSGYGNTQ